MRANAPLIVLTAPRSCSTVTVAMLSGHPQLYGIPEISPFPIARIGELLKTRYDRTTVDGLWHRRALLRAIALVKFGSFAPAAIAAAEDLLIKWSERPSSDLVLELADHIAPRILVEKSPRTTEEARGVRDCLESLPHARFIHLVRHPLLTVRSQVQHWRWRGAFAEFDDATLHARAVHDWYLVHHRISAALDALDESRWRRITAEDLLGHPRATLRGVISWLGLEHDDQTVEAMLASERWPFATGPADAHGGDITFFQRPALRGPRPAPRTWQPLGSDIPRAVDGAVRDLAARLGYADAQRGTG